MTRRSRLKVRAAARPSLTELYLAGRNAYLLGRESFNAGGRRYLVEVTTLGRVRVLDARTHAGVVSGPFGDVL